ncbi:sigma-70 family RNA polymerase sigma factor [Pedobacter psychrodurus]|uniref:Sigma-70 family RNA polymerase sigma factor n=1 Tax=Pedobacter psychrodurus TaxID=2530456 RepID=A0A4R0PIP5_9SPHI|nr:sigma-70 family RNA polymerase sigma factor [Pedobacter psychrodurus]TCD17070.1 sigma-70 family RNA polymerase sigma factor [Pedobacter psychrodurus]
MIEKSYLDKLEAHKGIIYKMVNLYADDEEDRKDLYQEIVFQSWNAYGRFKGDAKFSTWLYKLSLNVSLSFLSKQKKHSQVKDRGQFEHYFEPPELSERADWLYRCIKQLTEIDRSIIMLHLDGFDNTEISEMTGISRNNTNVKLHRIKQQLTTLLTRK